MTELLLDSQEIGKNLSRVKFIRKAVPYGNARILCKFLNKILTVAAVLDAVKHTREHPRRVGYALLLPICEPSAR